MVRVLIQLGLWFNEGSIEIGVRIISRVKDK